MGLPACRPGISVHTGGHQPTSSSHVTQVETEVLESQPSRSIFIGHSIHHMSKVTGMGAPRASVGEARLAGACMTGRAGLGRGHAVGAVCGGVLLPDSARKVPQARGGVRTAGLHGGLQRPCLKCTHGWPRPHVLLWQGMSYEEVRSMFDRGHVCFRAWNGETGAFAPSRGPRICVACVCLGGLRQGCVGAATWDRAMVCKGVGPRGGVWMGEQAGWFGRDSGAGPWP